MDPTIGYVSVLIMVGLLFLRVPVAVTLVAVGFCGIWYLRGFGPAYSSASSAPYDFIAHWTLSAVPTFVLMGAIASRAGMTAALYRAMRLWFGRLPGGLAIATSFAGAGFAAICGSSLATTAAMGRIAVPEMLRYRYDVSLATASAAAVGTIGALIPPSIIMVIYAIFAELSVSKMLIAGILPGLLTAVTYSAQIYIRCRLNPSLAPVLDDEIASLREKVAALGPVWPIAVIAAGVSGSIYGGWATATEAGAAGALLTALVAMVQRRFSYAMMRDTAMETCMTVASVLFIAIGASIMTQFLAISGMPFHLSGLITDLTENQTVVIVICCLLYLVLGAFLDPLGIMLLTLPILLPVFHALDINGIWAGIILVKMLEIGLITPPLGLNVYVMKNVMGSQVTLGQIFAGVGWFLVAELVVMTLLIAFPQIIMVLPNMM